MDKYEKKSRSLVAALKKELKAIYDEVANEVGILGQTNAGYIDMDHAFSLSKYPTIKRRVDALIKRLNARIGIAIVNGVRSQWTLANEKNNELVNVVFGKFVNSLTEAQMRRYYYNNDDALEAFLVRKIGGLKLSDRVWNCSKQFRGEIESTLELGIKTGQSAAEIARDLKEYLVHPDKLFRRVRDEKGRLHLSEPAKRFHPGVGVNRSSYKNALRLAATENNMAYRTADNERIQQLDFVVGIEIHLSNNHTLNGEPFYDICDELAGRYPKEFKFVGWHPLCRCFVTTILKTPEEVKRDMDGIDRGSVNEVKKLPPQFRAWLRNNADRIAISNDRGMLPYFLRDNRWAWRDLSVAEVLKHLQNKESLTTTEIEYVLKHNPDMITEDIFSENGKWTAQRERLHKEIIARYIGSGSVESDTVYMLGGAPANGKSTVVNSGQISYPEGILTLDVDAVKKMIPEYSRSSNSAVKFVKDNAANFVHEESSYLGKRIQSEVFSKGQSLVIDGVNDGSFEKVAKKVASIREQTGKRVRADYVTCDTETSIKRNEERYLRTGRRVRPDVVEHDNAEISRIVPRLIQENTFDELYLWDTNSPEGARLILSMIDGVLTIKDEALYRRFLDKAL